MPRSPDSIKAEKMYKSGMKLCDIAKKLGVPDVTVRRWKSTQNWDGDGKKKQSERSGAQSERPNSKPNVTKNTHGGRRPGTGGPVGNKKAEKHGAYSEIRWDWMTDAERDLMDGMPLDEESLLVDEIQHLTVRERRIEQAIKQYTEAPGGIYLERQTKTEVRRTFKDETEREEYEARIREKVDNGDRLPGDPYNLETDTESTINLITRLEKELSTVQKQKTAAISALAKIRLDKEKAESESVGSATVNDWISSIMEADDE